MNQEVKFYLSRDVKTPTRGTDQAAGIDLYIPYYNEQFANDFYTKNPTLKNKMVQDTTTGEWIIKIEPHERINVPSGVHVFMTPIESALIAANKSGISTKKGLVFTCQVIDSDYTGEIHMGVVNTSNDPVEIKTGEKLVQFIHTPVYFSKLTQVKSEEYYALHENSVRGDGAFGSTGK